MSYVKLALITVALVALAFDHVESQGVDFFSQGGADASTPFLELIAAILKSLFHGGVIFDQKIDSGSGYTKVNLTYQLIIDSQHGEEESKMEPEKVDPCDPNPCLNGGTCNGGGEKPTCECLSQAKGDMCENMDPTCTYSESLKKVFCLLVGTPLDGLDETQKSCKDSGFDDLVNIKDAETQKVLADFLTEYSKVDVDTTYLIIGLFSMNKDNQFTYADGSSLGSFNAWGPSQPSNEACVYIYLNYSDSEWYWRNDACPFESAANVICENKFE